MLDTGYEILDTGCEILDAGYEMLDTGYGRAAITFIFVTDGLSERIVATNTGPTISSSVTLPFHSHICLHIRAG